MTKYIKNVSTVFSDRCVIDKSSLLRHNCSIGELQNESYTKFKAQLVPKVLQHLFEIYILNLA